MNKASSFNVTFNKSTYDIISGSTEFYAFMGNNRLYLTFEKLFEPYSAITIMNKIKAKDFNKFFVNLLDSEGNAQPTLAEIKNIDDTSDSVDILLTNIEETINSANAASADIKLKNAILSLYNDFYFEYRVFDKTIRLFSVNKFEKNIFDGDISEGIKDLKNHIDDESIADCDALFEAIRVGTRDISHTLSGDLFSNGKSSKITVRGSSIYNNGIYKRCFGYIHVGNDRINNANKTVERDSLTGVLAKGEITNLLIDTIDVKQTPDVCFAIIDIDYFKKVNDTYGHMMGDEILKKVAGIIEDEVSDTGVVGRIGGDEFVVLFYNAHDMEDTRERLRSIKNTVLSAYGYIEEGNPKISLSIGCASYPKDADNYHDIFTLADFCLYRAKEKGRNRYIIYNLEKHGTLEDIKNREFITDKINNRGDMTPGDMYCAIADKVYFGMDYPVDKLLDDIVMNFGIQRIMVYAGKDYKLVGMAGSMRPDSRTISLTEGYCKDTKFLEMFDSSGCMVVNDITRLNNYLPDVYASLHTLKVLSFVAIQCRTKSGKNCIISLECVSKRETWNDTLLPCYHLIGKLMAEYDFEI